jgi:hypothetical protein
MYQDYQKYQIVIYYPEKYKSLVGWAKTFWLLKTAHPIICEQIPESALLDQSKSCKNWLKTYLSESQDLQALFVPPFVRSHIELDFIQDTHKQNRFAYLKNGSRVICQVDSQSDEYTEVKIHEIFEDLSSEENLLKIEDEIKLIKEHLLINI